MVNGYFTVRKNNQMVNIIIFFCFHPFRSFRSPILVSSTDPGLSGASLSSCNSDLASCRVNFLRRAPLVSLKVLKISVAGGRLLNRVTCFAEGCPHEE